MWSKMIRTVLSVLFVVSILVGCSAAAEIPNTSSDDPGKQGDETPSADSELTPLKVGVFHFSSFSPLFIAAEEGYFEEQGLDVELINFGGASNEIIPALASGELDAAGYSMSVAVFNAVLEGINIKYVADKGFMDPNNCVTDAWVANAALIADGSLAGKTVVFPPGGTIEYALDILLAQSNLRQEDIVVTNIADSSARVEGLNSGQVDMSALSEPWILRAQETGAGDVYAPFSALIPNESLGTMVFGPTILSADSDIGTRFMVAYLRGVQAYNEGLTERNLEIISSYTGQDPAELQNICVTSFQADGRIDEPGMIAFMEWALEKGYIETALTIDQYWTSEYIDSAYGAP